MKKFFEIIEIWLVAEFFRVNGFENVILRHQESVAYEQRKIRFLTVGLILDRNHFNYLVRKYNDDKYVKHLTCWNQFLAMMFGQLSNRESLRDLIVALEAHHSKCYHLGTGKNVLSDCIIEFTEYKATKDYPKRLRLVRFFDEEQG